MSAFGTTPTFRDVRSMSVIEGISEVKYSLRVFRLLTLNGPSEDMFKTGFIEGSAADAERSNWSGDGPRPLTWAAWYPAEDAAVEEPGFIGPPDQPLFVMGPLARGARLSESAKRWPVVLVSHGTGGTATGLGWARRCRHCRHRGQSSRQYCDRAVPRRGLPVLVGAGAGICRSSSTSWRPAAFLLAGSTCRGSTRRDFRWAAIRCWRSRGRSPI